MLIRIHAEGVTGEGSEGGCKVVKKIDDPVSIKNI